MQYRINDKGNVYKINLEESSKHLNTLGLDVGMVTLHINELGSYVDKEEDISIIMVNDGSF